MEVKKLKIGSIVYRNEYELGGRTIFKGIVDEYSEELEMYYIKGEGFDDWFHLSDLFTSNKKAKYS